MINREKVQDLSNKIKEIINSSPITDANKNLHALLVSMLTKMELVTREEFDTQAGVLKRSQSKIIALEEKIQKLEVQIKHLEQEKNSLASK